MTPTYEANRLMTASPGYKRPKTPTSASPVVFQRPKTPNQVATKSKSGYRGLTPAEYAAFGGIKTYTPAFGISGSTQLEEVKVVTEESVECKTFAQEPPVKLPSTAKESKATETFKDTVDEKASITASIPMIIVSSDVSDAKLPPDQSVSSNQVPVKQEKVYVHEMPKAEAPTAEVKTPENQKAETSVQGVTKLNTQTPETKPTLPQGPDQDPLKAVRKLLGKSKPPPAESIASPESKPAEPRSATAPVPEPAESKDKAAPEIKEAGESRPTAEPVLKVLQKPKEMKSKTSGWSRLKKHMVVEQEEPKFPDAETGPVIEATGQDQNKVTKGDEVVHKLDAQDENQTKDAPKATKMWDAVLFQMFSTKENIMYQIELNKSEEEKQNEEIKGELKEIPSFAYRLPVLLFSPKFDAKKLREAASRPVTKISTVFEMGLIGRKGKDEEPKDFNRTARGFINS
ncbi:proline-rich protein 33 [Betta splendens]|uniref:Proline-rich protein 33 n=1 Tax=Betta splendens TaxID=158456 RepID=A0A8M1HFK9_BETSP|nr:proline-rich protein 33 [Betta splendens]